MFRHKASSQSVCVCWSFARGGPLAPPPIPHSSLSLCCPRTLGARATRTFIAECSCWSHSSRCRWRQAIGGHGHPARVRALPSRRRLPSVVATQDLSITRYTCVRFYTGWSTYMPASALLGTRDGVPLWRYVQLSSPAAGAPPRQFRGFGRCSISNIPSVTVSLAHRARSPALRRFLLSMHEFAGQSVIEHLHCEDLLRHLFIFPVHPSGRCHLVPSRSNCAALAGSSITPAFAPGSRSYVDMGCRPNGRRKSLRGQHRDVAHRAAEMLSTKSPNVGHVDEKVPPSPLASCRVCGGHERCFICSSDSRLASEQEVCA